MKSVVIGLAIVLGILLLVTAGIYFVEPAKALPHFFPGYDASLSKIHRTHAVGSLLLALCLFVFAWFQSGKKSMN